MSFRSLNYFLKKKERDRKRKEADVKPMEINGKFTEKAEETTKTVENKEKEEDEV